MYEYKQTLLTAFSEVVNNMNRAENRRSVELKEQQVLALDASVKVARDLFNAPIKEEFAQVEYV